MFLIQCLKHWPQTLSLLYWNRTVHDCHRKTFQRERLHLPKNSCETFKLHLSKKKSIPIHHTIAHHNIRLSTKFRNDSVIKVGVFFFLNVTSTKYWLTGCIECSKKSGRASELLGPDKARLSDYVRCRTNEPTMMQVLSRSWGSSA